MTGRCSCPPSRGTRPATANPPSEATKQSVSTEIKNKSPRETNPLAFSPPIVIRPPTSLLEGFCKVPDNQRPPLKDATGFPVTDECLRWLPVRFAVDYRSSLFRYSVSARISKGFACCVAAWTAMRGEARSLIGFRITWCGSMGKVPFSRLP